MKSVKTLLAILAFSFVVTSCSKNDDDDAAAGDGTLTAKVDGTNFNSTLAVQASQASGTLSIGGTGSDGQITIMIPAFTGPATYTVASGAAIATYSLTTAPFTGWSASGIAGSGTVTVTENSGGRVKGTFSFTAVSSGAASSKTITEGKFNIEL
ncbi:MAG: hypothetical protein EOO07_12505 [Chitinophagaceae bacterium]|nr:MAG: hypothetical protein EOO07_12505 [Chitinophagaceae bacterium]